MEQEQQKQDPRGMLVAVSPQAMESLIDKWERWQTASKQEHIILLQQQQLDIQMTVICLTKFPELCHAKFAAFHVGHILLENGEMVQVPEGDSKNLLVSLSTEHAAYSSQLAETRKEAYSSMQDFWARAYSMFPVLTLGIWKFDACAAVFISDPRAGGEKR